jgi:serine/threonine protein kinase/tetratricopeptide (TPR) repeat protein
MRDRSREAGSTQAELARASAEVAARTSRWPEIPGYRLIAEAGTGGMGQVFRARALADEREVAVKVLRSGLDSLDAKRRLLHEAETLEDIRHPAVVEYIDHGVSGEGLPYLVMEWLEGIDLEQVLRERRLSIVETLTLGVRLTGCLAAAHDRGVVHRDIKPANIFLVDGEVARARLLDFGVARVLGHSLTLTRIGGVLGTPAYMSPEQARGDTHVDQRSDLFALGCVLFECVTGQPAFAGEHVLAILAKILLNPQPRVGELETEVPPGLEQLIDELLRKDADERPASARDVRARLLAIDTESHTPSGPAKPAITRAEQAFHSVLFCRGELATRPSSGGAVMQTLVDLPRLAESHEGSVIALADGTHLLIMDRGGAVADQANSAARCALSLRARTDQLALAVVSGRAHVTGRAVTGELLDRGAQLLHEAASGSIRIDVATANLLDPSFTTRGDVNRLMLVASEGVAAGSGERSLLGKSVEMVGRRRELAAVVALAEECFEESEARGVLVVGEPGIGKSRLRREFERRLAERGLGPAVHLRARGDAMSAGAPFSMLARLLIDAADIGGAAAPSAKARKLRTRLSRQLPADELERVLLYLAELVAPIEQPPDELAVAREDAALMRQRIEAAWFCWLRAESRAGPVLIAIEDFHCGDHASTRLLEATLDALEDEPVFVLALSRPGGGRLRRFAAHEHVESIELQPLSARAAKRLLRGAVGPSLRDEEVARIVDTAGGNPLFLEELLRMFARGEVDDLPETVFGLLEQRMATLSADERRILRAASVFGEEFWVGGVRALLGEVLPVLMLEHLVHDEWIVRIPRSRVVGEEQFVFRHGLVRDAAYASLTQSDRRLAHRLAAAWLEHNYGHDALMLAEHYRRGEAKSSAARWFAVASEEAFERYDFDAVQELVARGLDCAPSGEARGRLLVRRATVLEVRGHHRAAAEDSFAALEELPEHTPHWYRAIGEAALASARSGDSERVLELGERVARFDPDAVRREVGGGERLMSLVAAAVPLTAAGSGSRALDFVEHVRGIASTDPGARGPMHAARALAAIIEGDLATAFDEMLGGARAFEAVGSVRYALEFTGGAGFFCLELGDLERGEALLRETIERSREVGLEHLCAVARHNLGRRVAETGRVDEALKLELDALRSFEVHDNPRMQGLTLAHLAWILLLGGRLDEAQARADQAVERLTDEPASQIIALAIRARIYLRLGRLEAAKRDARSAIDTLESLDQVQEGESFVRLTWAELHVALDDGAGARAAIAAAFEQARHRADKLDEARRPGFWALPENAEIAALAREWLTKTDENHDEE